MDNTHVTEHTRHKSRKTDIQAERNENITQTTQNQKATDRRTERKNKHNKERQTERLNTWKKDRQKPGNKKAYRKTERTHERQTNTKRK